MADKRQKRGAWDENKALVTSARQKFITLTCTQLLPPPPPQQPLHFRVALFFKCRPHLQAPFEETFVNC